MGFSDLRTQMDLKGVLLASNISYMKQNRETYQRVLCCPLGLVAQNIDISINLVLRMATLTPEGPEFPVALN
jgi:hypothetical protein